MTKKKRLICIGSFCFLLLLSTFLIKKIEMKEIREQYPYGGRSIMSDEEKEVNNMSDSSLETLDSITLTSFAKRKDAAFVGYFIDDVVSDEITVLPEKGTNEYKVVESLAEEFDSTVEKMAPKRKVLKYQFKVEDVVYSEENTLYRSKDTNDDIITLFVLEGDADTFPDVTIGDRKMIFGSKFFYDGEQGYITSSFGYYYVAEDDKIYSLEAFSGLDRYSGRKYQDVGEELGKEVKKKNGEVYTTLDEMKRE